MTATGRRRRLGPATALAVVVLGACSPGTGPPGTSPPAAASAPGPGPAPAGTAAAELEGTTLDGQPFSSSRLAGRPAVLWFWAPWCTVCRAEAPEIAEVAAEYADRVEVVGVAGRGDRASMQEFVADTGTGSLVHLVDEDGELWNRFGIVSQPAFVFVSRSGTTESFAGSLGGDRLRQIMHELDGE